MKIVKRFIWVSIGWPLWVIATVLSAIMMGLFFLFLPVYYIITGRYDVLNDDTTVFLMNAMDKVTDWYWKDESVRSNY